MDICEYCGEGIRECRCSSGGDLAAHVADEVPSKRRFDKIDTILAGVDRQLEAAHKRIEQEGSVADAALLMAVSQLAWAVNELAKRNDPLSAEKAEAEQRGAG